MDPILQLLNAKDEKDAIAILSKIMGSLADLKAALGVSQDAKFDEVMAAVRDSNAVASAAKALTGETDQGAIRGKLEAIKTSADSAKDLQAKMDAEKKQRDDNDAHSAIDAAVTEGRLPVAKREDAWNLYQEAGRLGLDTFLGALPDARVTTSQESPGQPNVEEGMRSKITDVDRAVMKAMGRSEEDYMAARAEYKRHERATGIKSPKGFAIEWSETRSLNRKTMDRGLTRFKTAGRRQNGVA